MRKRKRSYPPARTATNQRTGDRDAPVQRPTLVSIDLTARGGGGKFAVGDRVRINGMGLYAGQVAVVEALAGTAIPSALVRTAAGSTRRVRMIDLTPVGAEEGTDHGGGTAGGRGGA